MNHLNDRRLACRSLACIIALCGGSQLSSCTLPPLSRLEIASGSVVVVDRKDELPATEPRYLDYYLPILMVNLLSKTDLGALAKSGWSVGNMVSECADHTINPNAPLHGFAYAYDHFGIIPAFRQSGSSRISGGPDQPIMYHMYVRLSQVGTGSVGMSRSYNLLSYPRDICIRIDGVDDGIPIVSELVPIRFSSNVIVIRKEALLAAVRRSGLKI